MAMKTTCSAHGVELTLRIYPITAAGLFLRGDCKGNKSMGYRAGQIDTQSSRLFSGADIFLNSLRLDFEVGTGDFYLHMQRLLGIIDYQTTRRGLFPTIEGYQGRTKIARLGESNFVGDM